VPAAQQLSYSLQAGSESQYQVDLVQHISMTGEATGAAAEEEFPGEASIDVASSALFTYSVADGPDEGTYAITITGEFTDIEVSGTVDGVDITSEGEIPDMADLASLEPIDVTVIVDEQGNVVSLGDGLDDPLAGMFGDLGNLGSSTAPGLDPGQFVGVPFGDEEVTVGDSWSEDIETPGLDDEPIVTSVTSTVTGTDQINGSNVLVIETATSTSPIEFDLAEFFVGLLTAFGPPEGEDAAEFEAMMEQVRFLFTIDDTTSNSTTWFDAEAGLSRRFAMDSSSHIVMDLNVPDETTGELSGAKIDMSIDQQLDYELVGGPSA